MWVATRHPYVSAGIVAVGLLIILLLVRFVVRSVRNLLRDAENALTHNPPGTYVH
jgi:uncharacterized protein YoxC